MKNLRFAIIGCGRIGERHAKLLGSSLINNASLIAVCDINEEKSKKVWGNYIMFLALLIYIK